MSIRFWTLTSLWTGIVAFPWQFAVSQEQIDATLVYTLQTVDGTYSLGQMRQLTSDRITLNSPEMKSWNLDEVISLERVAQPAGVPQDEIFVVSPTDVRPIDPIKRVAPRLWLTNGDRFAVEITELDETFLTVRVLSLSHPSTWKIPLEFVRGYAEAEHSAHATQFAGRPSDVRGPTADVLSLKNGDRIAGELQGFADGNLTVETNTGVIEIPLDGIDVFAMNPDLMEFRTVEGDRVIAAFSDGSFLTLTELQTSVANGGDSNPATLLLTGTTMFGQVVAMTVHDLNRLTFLGRRAVMLSDLEVADYEFTPYFSRNWDYQLDRNVDGGPLMIDGREYLKGLGLHSQCRLSYQLNKQFTRFQTHAGVDDSVAEKGQAWLSILVDGEMRIERVLLQGATGVKKLDIDRLDGKRQLTFVVEFGPFGDVADHINLVNPILIRQSAVRR